MTALPSELPYASLPCSTKKRAQETDGTVNSSTPIFEPSGVCCMLLELANYGRCAARSLFENRSFVYLGNL